MASTKCSLAWNDLLNHPFQSYFNSIQLYLWHTTATYGLNEFNLIGLFSPFYHSSLCSSQAWAPKTRRQISLRIQDRVLVSVYNCSWCSGFTFFWSSCICALGKIVENQVSAKYPFRVSHFSRCKFGSAANFSEFQRQETLISGSKWNFSTFSYFPNMISTDWTGVWNKQPYTLREQQQRSDSTSKTIWR